VSAATITLALFVLVKHRKAGLTRPAILLLMLLATQLTLGVLTVLWGKPADIASAHVAVGALVLVTTFVLAVRAMRIYPLGAGWTRPASGPAKQFGVSGEPSPT
jgi:heme A synthase